MADFNTAVAALWPAFAAAGMLDTASDDDGDFYVGFTQPDRTIGFDGNSRTREFEIEYQYSDRPSLAKGSALTIDGVNYRVREAPYVADEGNAAGGIFWRAVLTRVP